MIFSIRKMSKKGGMCLAVALFISLFILSFASSAEQSTESFDLNSLVLKASVVKGDAVTKVLTISKGHGQDIYLEVVGLKGINISETSFVLGQDASKNVQVRFDSSTLAPGVYSGSIKVSDGGNILFLPVIFEVESKDVFYDANLEVAPQYSKIMPGDKLVAQLKIFDLTSGGTTNGLGRNSIIVEYNIRNIEGKIISTETESVVVDKQAQITKAISFPKNIQLGDYVISVVVKYKSSVGTASYLFTIDQEATGNKLLNYFTKSIDLNFIVFIALIIIFFLAMMFIFIYVIKGRDSIILEMKNYNEQEYEAHRKFILAQESLLRSKGTKVHEIVRQRKEKIAKLKKTYQDRSKKVKQLKKQGNEKEMQEQLVSWKKQGYNTLGLEYKMKGLSSGEMKSLLGMWKKQYSGDEGYKKRLK